MYELFTEVTIPMENATVSLREEGKFFCQVMGNNAKLRIDGQDTAQPYKSPGDLVITVDNATSVDSCFYYNYWNQRTLPQFPKHAKYYS